MINALLYRFSSNVPLLELDYTLALKQGNEKYIANTLFSLMYPACSEQVSHFRL
jgi:hypothetical protein